MDFGDHWYVGNTWRCKASKYFVDGSKRSFCWVNNRLPMTLTPHVTFAWLMRYSGAERIKKRIFKSNAYFRCILKRLYKIMIIYIFLPDMIVMRSGNVDNSSKIFANPDWRATVRFISCTQLSIWVCAPGIQMAFVRQCHCMSISTNYLKCFVPKNSEYQIS